MRDGELPSPRKDHLQGARSILELCTGEVQGMEGKAQSDPTAQPAFTNADFRFGFPALPRCRLSIKGEFSPQ